MRHRHRHRHRITACHCADPEREWMALPPASSNNSNLDGQGPATELVRDFDRP